MLGIIYCPATILSPAPRRYPDTEERDPWKSARLDRKVGPNNTSSAKQRGNQRVFLTLLEDNCLPWEKDGTSTLRGLLAICPCTCLTPDLYHTLHIYDLVWSSNWQVR